MPAGEARGLNITFPQGWLVFKLEDGEVAVREAGGKNPTFDASLLQSCSKLTATDHPLPKMVLSQGGDHDPRRG